MSDQDWMNDPRLKAAALSGSATNRHYSFQERLGMALQAVKILEGLVRDLDQAAASRQEDEPLVVETSYTDLEATLRRVMRERETARAEGIRTGWEQATEALVVADSMCRQSAIGANGHFEPSEYDSSYSVAADLIYALIPPDPLVDRTLKPVAESPPPTPGVIDT